MLRLEKFIPGDVCLSCDGCCWFSARNSVWPPFFAYEEIVELTQKDIVPSCLFSHPDIRRGTGAQIDLIRHRDMYLCPCFDNETNMCKIYSQTPLECRLYPFLLARKGKEVFCAVDEHCPYVQKVKNTDRIARYAQYLIVYFSTQEFYAFLGKNPSLVQDYGEDVAYIKSLPALSSILYGTSTSFPET